MKIIDFSRAPNPNIQRWLRETAARPAAQGVQEDTP